MVEHGTRATSGVARGVGAAVATLIGGLSRVRPADKPMHPRGVVLDGVLRRHGGAATGAAFLDEPGEDAVLVRWSRSVGLPTPWPDVGGLAIRVPTPGGPLVHADVLMSSTGRGRLTRYALRPTTDDHGPFLCTLLPFRAPTGPVHLAVRSLDGGRHELLWARPRSAWTAFADLDLSDQPGRDLEVSFDPIAGGPPGLEVYEWHRLLRGPSYAAARRVRGAASPHETRAH